MRILVVDDETDVEPLFRQRFRREIRAGSLELLFAFTGSDALSLFVNERPGIVLVLSDINMPGMNGIELLQAIRELDPEVAVMMMSAYDMHEYANQANDFRSEGFLAKPVDFGLLRSRIEQIAGRAS